MAGEGKFDLRIEPLDERHDRAAFSCGVDELDRYLSRQARQDAKRHVAAVFVAAKGTAIAGYFTLSAHALSLCDLPADFSRKLPRYPAVPATLLGRLAVDRKYQGQGLGEYLLMAALRRALGATRHVASVAVVVDAKDVAARRFYERLGFRPLAPQSMRLYYPMKSIAALFPEDTPGE